MGPISCKARRTGKGSQILLEPDSIDCDNCDYHNNHPPPTTEGACQTLGESSPGPETKPPSANPETAPETPCQQRIEKKNGGVTAKEERGKSLENGACKVLKSPITNNPMKETEKKPREPISALSLNLSGRG